MTNSFAILSGQGEPDALLRTLAASFIRVSTSHAAVSDPRATAVCLLPPLTPSDRSLATHATARALPVFSFGPCPPPLATPGAWVPVGGLGLWAAAWRWRPVSAPSLLA